MHIVHILALGEGFNSRLREEATWISRLATLSFACFNSRLREEATTMSEGRRRHTRGFNSRLREEATRHFFALPQA